MPRLICRTCGEAVYSVEPFEALFAEERRCRRCGQFLFTDRRSGIPRRTVERRAARPHDSSRTAPRGGERREAERRTLRRRRDDKTAFGNGEQGWFG